MVGRRWVSGVDPQGRGTKAWGVLSVWERLIEFEFGSGFWIGGVEPAGLIEREVAADEYMPMRDVIRREVYLTPPEPM